MAFRALSAPAIRRLRPEDAEIPVATGEDIVIAIVLREPRSHGEFGQRSQQGKVIQVGGNPRMNQIAETLFEPPTLAPLVVDRHAVVFESRARRRALIGERDRIVAIKDRGSDEDRRIDRGHRNMSIERTCAVVVEQDWRDRARDIEHRQHSRDETMIAYSQSFKPEYKIGLLSNIDTDTIDRLFPEPERNQLFDAFVVSGAIGITKPSVHIFNYAASQLGLLPEECLMIDDIAANVEGAQLAGMEAIRFISREQCSKDIKKLLTLA